MVDAVDTNDTPVEDDWRARYARMREKICRTDEVQKSWQSMPPTTLVDAAKVLCDRDAPPPTREELLWLKENLIQHQHSVEQLIQLIETLLSSQTPPLDEVDDSKALLPSLDCISNASSEGDR